jgi:hypothetical protein
MGELAVHETDIRFHVHEPSVSITQSASDALPCLHRKVVGVPLA